MRFQVGSHGCRLLASIDGMPITEDFFVRLSPDTVLNMARLYLSVRITHPVNATLVIEAINPQYAPATPQAAGEATNPVLTKCARLLEALTKPAPGILEGVYLLAR